MTDKEPLAHYASERGFFIAPAGAARRHKTIAEAEVERVSPYFTDREGCRRALALKAAEYGCEYVDGPTLVDAHDRARARRELSAVAEQEALPLLRQMRPKDLVALFTAELARLLEEGIDYDDFQAAKAARTQIARARRELRGVS